MSYIKEIRQQASEIVADMFNDWEARMEGMNEKEYRPKTQMPHINLTGFWCGGCGVLTLMDTETMDERGYGVTGKRYCDACYEKNEKKEAAGDGVQHVPEDVREGEQT